MNAAQSPVLTRAQSRQVDEVAIERFQIPGVVLMENAGRNCARLLWDKFPEGTFTIVAGKGNNAGDGFVIARHLRNWGGNVRLLLVADPRELQGDALINWRIVEAMRLPCMRWLLPGEALAPEVATQEEAVATDRQAREWLQERTCIVDALLGTGLQGEVREPFRSVIDAINKISGAQGGPPVLAVDIPSGLNADTGQPWGNCIHATLTATFVASKQGFLNPTAAELTGPIHVLDIGAPPEVLAEVLSAS